LTLTYFDCAWVREDLLYPDNNEPPLVNPVSVSVPQDKLYKMDQRQIWLRTY
jgi:hypothetical protein